MGPIMDNTGESIGILCHGLIATRLCKLTDFLRFLSWLRRFESTSPHLKMSTTSRTVLFRVKP